MRACDQHAFTRSMSTTGHSVGAGILEFQDLSRSTLVLCPFLLYAEALDYA